MEMLMGVLMEKVLSSPVRNWDWKMLWKKIKKTSLHESI